MKKRNSLAASHSKSSNAYLTFLCLLGAFGFAGMAMFAGLSKVLPQAAFITGVIASAAAFLVSALALVLFKR